MSIIRLKERGFRDASDLSSGIVFIFFFCTKLYYIRHKYYTIANEFKVKTLSTTFNYGNMHFILEFLKRKKNRKKN